MGKRANRSSPFGLRRAGGQTLRLAMLAPFGCAQDRQDKRANGPTGQRVHGQKVLMPLTIRETPSGLVFKIFVQPRSSKNAVVGIHGDALKIKLTASPVDGKANKACLQFLAKVLGVAKSDLDIVSGHSSRTKQIRWESMSDGEAAASEIARFKRVLMDLVGE